MGYVDPFHQQVIVTYNGTSFGCCATVDGHIFADGIIVTYLGSCFFAPELQVLRNSTDDSAGKNGVTVSDAATIQDTGVGHYLVVVTDDYILVNEDKGSDFHVLADLRFGMDVC